MLATLGAPEGPVACIQPFPAAAHPSGGPGRYAHHESVIWHIVRDHSTCSYKGVLPDRSPAYDRRVRTHRCPSFHQCRSEIQVTVHLAPRVGDIREYDGGPANT